MILLDIGGTFIKRSDGLCIPMPSAGSAEEIAGALRQATAGEAEAIGVAIPGPFDYEHGIFLMRHKFASVYGKSFRELAGIADCTQLKFMHDVNAPLLGAVQMLGLQEHNTALVTLGTGLGFSAAIKGKVQFGPNGSPAVSLWDKPYGEGIAEDIVSARGIRLAYGRLGGDNSLSAREIAQRAQDGDILARNTFSGMGRCLGEVLGQVCAELKLDTILFGGQISKSMSLFEEPLKAMLPGLRMEAAPQGAVYEGLLSLFQKNTITNQII